MKKLTLVLLALILAACSAGGSELSRNQSKWQDAGITHYRFQLSVSCFCLFRSQMPLTVEVQDGEVVSMIDVNGEAFPMDDPMSDLVMKHATIDRIFSELGSDPVQKADNLTVSYDPTYGFPTEVAIDYIELAADDELYISVSGFEPLP
ncbi:MAG: hypothetical protein C3F07_06940 [Anaerolineales bacterium]|nr:hypothetical protein [Anaerolineae bacterium]PWB74794.1 MAG: hypothetical protein C3F07_06940 [Anaerolineales bacterium]